MGSVIALMAGEALKSILLPYGSCARAAGFNKVSLSVLSSRVGTFCNCSASASAMDTNQCKGPGMTEPCSGRGDCLECGTCVCYNPDQFEGPYCQYDKTQCLRFGGFLCNGVCD